MRPQIREGIFGLFAVPRENETVSLSSKNVQKIFVDDSYLKKLTVKAPSWYVSPSPCPQTSIPYKTGVGSF